MSETKDLIKIKLILKLLNVCQKTINSVAMGLWPMKKMLKLWEMKNLQIQ